MQMRLFAKQYPTLWAAMLTCMFGAFAASACEAPAIPVIQVNVPMPNFAVEKAPGYTIAAHTYDTSGHQVSGVTLYNPQVQMSVLFNNSSGLLENCITIASINVTIADQNPRILIAEELPRGSCIEARLIEHENKHAAAYKQAYGRLNNSASAALAAAFHGYSANVLPGSEAAIQQQVYNRIEQLLAPMVRQADDDAWTQHRIIDSPQEYDAIRASCNGELDQYLK